MEPLTPEKFLELVKLRAAGGDVEYPDTDADSRTFSDWVNACAWVTHTYGAQPYIKGHMKAIQAAYKAAQTK